ncbi:MAG TPA: head GIN domain-containing protein [Mucilaginibacter sp.]|nr:head GIN domain-containing protein [Mucilaginibacter sp.]
MKILIRSMLALLFVAGTSYAFAQRVEDRHLSGFTAIDVGGPYDVQLTQGNTESVKVQAPDEVMDHIITEVVNGTLKIYNKHDDGFHWNDLFGHHRKVLVYVTAKTVNSIVVSGSGDVAFRDGIHSDKMTLRVSGSGDVNGRLEVKALEVGISGSGDVNISGHAETSAVRVSGSGDYKAHNLITSNTDVHVSGSGDASIYASNKVDASVSGSGDIRYAGNPKSVYKSKSGSGDIGGD